MADKKTIDGKTRKKIETLIYEFFDALDKTHMNTDKYKEEFSKMNNEQFLKHISKKFPYRFYHVPFKNTPSMNDIVKSLNVLGVPLLEKVTLPYLYKDETTGKSVQTKECMVVYLPLKKVKQFIEHKNSYGIDISKRDMKTGLLTGSSKGGKESDREVESLQLLGLDKTTLEFMRPKADAMKAKNMMNTLISQKGKVSQKEIPIDADDSLAKNLLNVYLIGSQLNSNLINQDYYLPGTLNSKKKNVIRV